MATKINCLRELTSPQSPKVIASKLNITSLKLLELIGQINKLEDLVKNQSGDQLYLTRSIDWLDLEQITGKLKKNSILQDYIVQILDEVESTNDYVLNNLNKIKNQTVVIAEYQSRGRARNGKVWITRLANDITASFVYQLDIDFKYELLPITIAVAVNRLFKRFGIISKIKWPNDVMLEDFTKIAGILVESCVRDNKRYVIIGTGIDNIGSDHTGVWDRNSLFVSLIEEVANIISEYKNSGFDLIRQEWLDNCIHYHNQIKLYQGDNLITTGTHIGLSDNGGLIIKNSNGDQKEYIGGNISLVLSI